MITDKCHEMAMINQAYTRYGLLQIHSRVIFKLSAPTENLSIDEQMVPFKARSRLKQYNPQKPKKLGYKRYVLTSPEGQICNFEVHTGAIEMFPGQRDLQASGNIVMHLLSCIP